METAREEELMAMENIFGPEEFRRSETTLGGVMQVSLQLPNDFRVREGDINKEHDVTFLPPVVVDFERLTQVILHPPSDWVVNGSAIIRVCRHLDELWQDSGGEPVLFSWFQFLREDLLDFLSISSPWVIPCMEESDGDSSLQDADSRDPRVTTSASTDTGDLLNWLLDHDQKMQQRDFEGQSFDCGICFSTKSGLDCYRFKGCEHVFCKDCISNVFKIAIEEGRVFRFSCPDADCNAMATHAEVKALVGEELFCRYDQLLLQKTLDCMSDVVYCPRPNCSSPVVQEPEESWAFCASCAFAFCTKCREGYHGVDTCPNDSGSVRAAAKARNTDDSSETSSDYIALPKTLEGMKVLWKDYEKGSAQRRQLLLQRYGKKLFFGGIGDALCVDWIQTNTQECPNCSVKIHKIGGCHMMRCAHCFARFCWDCHVVIHFNDNYSHRCGDGGGEGNNVRNRR